MMKKFFVFLTLFLMATVTISAKTCGYCHGNGRIKIPGVSGYGVGAKYKTCNVCGQRYDTTTDHWHTCPQCNGTGQSGSSGSSGIGSNDGEDIYLRYLTAAEYQDWRMQLEIAMKGIDRQVTCPDCNGTGLCRACNGSGMSPIQGPVDPDFGFFPNPCPICSGIKSCKRCAGLKWIYVHSDDGKEQANQKLIYYRDLVYKRMANQR